MRYVDTPLDRPRVRGTVNYRLLRRLQVGVELNPLADEIGPLVSAFLLTETERWPALFVGTSSDRIGSPAGTQSYYLTAAKYLPIIRSGVYASLNYSEWSDGWNVPFGGSVELGSGISVRGMYDGQRSHLLANWFGDRWGFSLIYVWLERGGIAVSTGF